MRLRTITLDIGPSCDRDRTTCVVPRANVAHTAPRSGAGGAHDLGQPSLPGQMSMASHQELPDPHLAPRLFATIISCFN